MRTLTFLQKAISIPISINIQSGRISLLQLCKKNFYSAGCRNLSIFSRNSYFNQGLTLRKSVLFRLKRNNYDSVLTRATISNGNIPGALSKKQAKELALKLTPEERDVLISALRECQSLKLKAEYQSQLAAFRWRNKFGRPSTIPSLGTVDPTGSYCAVPDDWLLRKYVETVPSPTRKELFLVGVNNAIPFIGFGFLDNFIMIVAGDTIEFILGQLIFLSTMAYAAIGNLISDVMGIGSAPYVELFARKVGFKAPKLTPIQLDLPKSRRASNYGRVIGVTVGCVLGMIPLLFHHPDRKKEILESDKSPA